MVILMSKYQFSHKDMVEDWKVSFRIQIKYKCWKDKEHIEARVIF